MANGTPPTAAPVSSSKPGMGAIPYPGGTTFRVWAKFAQSVAVVGDFNNWSTTANPLAPDADTGYWSADVPAAAVGQTYKFHISQAQSQFYRIDPYATSIQQSANAMNAVITSQFTSYVPSSFTTPHWNEAIIYELHIPTFSTQTAGGGGGGGGGGNVGNGTFQTALPKLPDLAALGINVIQIMPLGQFKGIASTGYSPGYIFAIEDTWGGPDQFRDFVNQAHALGIAVIIDVVYNHLGDTDLWQFDGWASPDTNCPWDQYQPNGGIYFYQDYRAHTDYGHTRFDFGRPEVSQYIFDNAMRWLNERFVDGLRFDSVANIRAVQVNGSIMADLPDGRALLRRINQSVQTFQSWKITIAEDLQGWDKITAPLDDPDALGFTAQWNDSFCGALRNAAIQPFDPQRNIQDLADAIAGLAGPSAFKSILYSENHDQDDPTHNNNTGGRVPDRINPGHSDSWLSKKRSTLAAAVTLTAPGIPMIFQGQEFLEWRPFPNYGATPEPIDWGLATQFAGIKTLYRDLIRLRRNWFNNTRGLRGANTHVLPVYDNILIFHRWDLGGPGDDVIVICNFSNQGYPNYTIGLPRPGTWRVRFNSDASTYDAYFNNWNTPDTHADTPPLNTMPTSATLSIAPYTCIILSQD